MLAANNQSLEDYNYLNKEIGEIILNEIGDTKFNGVSGSVAFNEDTGDRIAWTKIEQLQRGKYEVVAYYDQKTDNLTWIPPPPYVTNRQDKVIWVGGGDKVPQDRTIVKPQLRMVNIWLYISMVALSLVGCAFAMAFIWFNFKYSHRR